MFRRLQRARIGLRIDRRRRIGQTAHMKRLIATLVPLLACFAAQTAVVRGQSPLQADVQVRVNYNTKNSVPFRSRLEGGGATVKGTVVNVPGSETATVRLRFNYRTNADIALDEIISQIIVSTSDADGNEFSRVTIDPNTVPLNPNRVLLSYSATLYKPPRSGRNAYIARVQVFGNYE